MDKEKAQQITVNLLIGFEQFRRYSYLDRSSSEAVRTIGFGQIYINHRKVQEGDSITYDDALSYLKQDVSKRMDEILIWAENNNLKLNENEAAALCSFAFNEGVSCLEKSSLGKDLIANNRENIKADFEMYNKIKINNKLVSSDGLLSRRRKEFDVFSSNS